MKPSEKPPFNIGFPEVSTVLMIPNKCGCTSIANVVKERQCILRRVSPADLGHYDTKIAIMRDPVDRFLSCYFGHVGPQRRHENLKYLFPEPVSIDEFAAYVVGHEDSECDIHFASQTCRFDLEPDQVVMLPDLDDWWRDEFAPALNDKGLSVQRELPCDNRSMGSTSRVTCTLASLAWRMVFADRFAPDYELMTTKELGYDSN